VQDVPPPRCSTSCVRVKLFSISRCGTSVQSRGTSCKTDIMKDYRQNMEAQKFYHVFNRGINSEQIFKCESNYFFFMRRCKEILPESMHVFAYCLMPTHFHLLVKIKENTKPAESFRRLFTSYSKAINNQERRHGGLFEKPFRRLHVDSESYLRQVVLYIHRNPIHHGIKKKPEDWEFSSFSDILNNKPAFENIFDTVDWFENRDNFFYCHKQEIMHYHDIDIE